MYQQSTATVLIFLKVPTTDSLVFLSEYISRTAILTQASELLASRILRFFIVLVLHAIICIKGKIISFFKD